MKVKVRWEIKGTTGYGEDVNIVNVDRDIVDGGCNGEVLSDRVIGEEGVRGEMAEGGQRCSLGRSC